MEETAYLQLLVDLAVNWRRRIKHACLKTQPQEIQKRAFYLGERELLAKNEVRHKHYSLRISFFKIHQFHE